MSDIRTFAYMPVAARVRLRVHVRAYKLEHAQDALDDDLRRGEFSGAAVLRCDGA